jgi:hypothetical protein
MKDNQIIFEIKDNKVKLHDRNKSINISEFIQVISTGMLMAMNAIVAAASEDMRQAVKEDLYDMYNAAASNVLRYFAPEIDMHPTLTTQAILEAEDKIIEREYAKAQKDPNYVSPIVDKQPALPKLQVVK